MNHLTQDQLVLHAYDEAPEPDREVALTHLASCATCRDRLARVERARVAVDLARQASPRRAARYVVLAALAAAAVVAAVWLRPAPATPMSALALPRYVAPELAPIDSILTRLEQQRSYANP